MHILVLNGSPSGRNSITLYTALFLQKAFPECHFSFLHAAAEIRRLEKDPAPLLEAVAAADLIVFCYPVYTFLVPSQLHRVVEILKAAGPDCSGKYATQITTSKHFYDMTAHRFMEDNCEDLGLRCIRGLSADMDDLLSEKGQQEAVSFFRYVLFSMEKGYHEPLHFRKEGTKALQKATVPETAVPRDASGRIAVVLADTAPELRSMVDRFVRVCPMETELVDLTAFPFAGGCIGCFHCAADGKCIYPDGFDAFLREHIQTADAIVYAYTVRDHSMGSLMKTYDDRQFCNGHRTVTMGRPVAYLVNGDLREEENLRTVMKARAEVGGNFLAGIADNARNPDAAVDQMAETLHYAVRQHLVLPKNFYGVGGLTIFRDLIYQMQGLMRADHRFYRKHGFYNFPQKKKGRILLMYLVGTLMNSPGLRKKIGGKMTEGMILPYRKVLEKAEASAGKKDGSPRE